MGGIIIAMPKYDDSNRLAKTIQASGVWAQTYICTSGNDVLRRLNNQDVSLVICTSNLGDMRYEELQSYLPSGISLILLTKDAGMMPMSSSVIPLLMPFKVVDLVNTIRMILPDAFSRPRKKVRSEEEQKLLDDAKKVLMDRNNMTEPEAFKYIQKSSMDSGRTMKETAQMILLLNGSE